MLRESGLRCRFPHLVVVNHIPYAGRRPDEQKIKVAASFAGGQQDGVNICE
jgi:hypothetical protein